MLLAGKSEVRHSFSLNRGYFFSYCCCQVLKRLDTFSFDKQNGGVSVGRCFHFSNQSFFFFIFFFFRLQTPQHQFQLIPFNSNIVSQQNLNELWYNCVCTSDQNLICSPTPCFHHPPLLPHHLHPLPSHLLLCLRPQPQPPHPQSGPGHSPLDLMVTTEFSITFVYERLLWKVLVTFSCSDESVQPGN